MLGEIYCIENLINGKRYIGKTERGWKYRWQLHQRDMNSPRCEHYPLYRALRKYGIENFKCYLIEETNELDIRERYWIQHYNTYGNGGYNATLGGDGRSSVGISDQDFIEAYYELGNIYKVAELFNCNRGTVSNRLKKNGIVLKTSGYNSVGVVQLSMDDVYINEFNSFREAAREMIRTGATTSTNEISIASNIRQTANGNRSYAYKFHWKLKGDYYALSD
jgi:hypothetical protein